MNIHQRLNQLEQRTGRASGEHGIPVKPMQWSDEQHSAVLTGLGIRNRLFSILTFSDEFIEQHHQTITHIFKELEQGITPSKVLVQAEPMERQL